MSSEAVVRAPKLFTSPHEFFPWVGNTVYEALAGAARLVADSISESRKASSQPQESNGAEIT